jgi:outer membrane lipoprotein carrier protein
VKFVRFVSITVATLIFSNAPLAHANSPKQLQALVDGLTTATASFDQSHFDKAGKAVPRSQSRGTFALSRPGKFRWQYTHPNRQLIVADGERVWIYDEDLKQVTVKAQTAALAGSPAAFLLGQGDLGAAFTLADGGQSDGLAWVAATPKARDSGIQSMRVGMAQNQLRRMEIVDALGNKSVISFTDVQRGAKLDAADFSFTPPKGVDVVGEAR